MKTYRVGFGLGVACAVLAFTARADEAVTLRYKMAKGDQAVYRTRAEMKQTQKFAGMTVETQFSQESVTSETVEKVDDEGNAHLSVKNERLKVKATFGPMGDYEYDSKSGERDTSSAIGKEITPLFQRLTGAVVQVAVNPRGEVQSVKGYAELIKDLVEGNPRAAQFVNGGTDEAAKLNFQDRFIVLKKESVKPDDEWEHPFKLEMLNIGTLEGKTTYKYVGRETIEQRDLAKLEVQTEISFDFNIDMGGAKITGKLSVSDCSGEAQFDVGAGRLVSTKGNVTLSGDLTVVDGGQVFPLSMEQVMTTSVEWLEKVPD